MTTNPVDKILTIEVAPGLKEYTRILFKQQGDQGPNKIPADIVFVVKSKPHELFKRVGDDLHIEKQVPLVQALVGYSLEIKTLDDRLLRIPINETIT